LDRNKEGEGGESNEGEEKKRKVIYTHLIYIYYMRGDRGKVMEELLKILSYSPHFEDE